MVSLRSCSVSATFGELEEENGRKRVMMRRWSSRRGPRCGNFARVRRGVEMNVCVLRTSGEIACAIYDGRDARERKRHRAADVAQNVRGEARMSCNISPTCNASKKRRKTRARASMRTWILDALRAATEPVKVEAMQAIVEVGCLGGSVWGVLDYDKSAEWRYYLCQLGRFFNPSD